MPLPYPHRLAQWLAVRLALDGVTARDLGALLGYPSSSMSMMMSGRRPMHDAFVAKLSTHYDLDPVAVAALAQRPPCARLSTLAKGVR